MTCMKIYTHGCHISYLSQILSMYLWTIHSCHQRHCRKLLKVVSPQRYVRKVSGGMLPKVFNKMYWSCFWGPLKMLVKFFIRSYKYIVHVVLIQSRLTAQQQSKSCLEKWNFTVGVAFIVCALMCAYILKRLMIVVSLVVLFQDRIFL